MAVRIGSKRHWPWRGVDEHGATLDVLLQERRDTEAAERFFRTLLGHAAVPPERITTDKLGSYAAALRRLPEFRDAEHLQVRSALRCNNRVEQAHQPTRIRERRMGRFRCPRSAQWFLAAFARVCNLFRPGCHLLSASEYRALSAFGRVSNLFCPGRHLLSASEYRFTMQERFATWRMVVGLPAA